jgi:hypothetical protein
MSGRAAEGVAVGRQALAISQTIGSPWGEVTVRTHLAQGLLETGELQEALAVAEAGTALARAHELAPLLTYSLCTEGAVHRAMRRFETARAAHEEALRVDEETPSHPFSETVYSELCADHVETGDWQAAHRYAVLAIEHRRDGTLSVPFTRRYEIEALARGGDFALAEEEAERFGALVASANHGAGNPRLELASEQCRAVLAEARRRVQREGNA